MSAPATISLARRDDLRRLLARGARDGRVDLGNRTMPNWASIDGFLFDADVSPAHLSALNRSDVEAVQAEMRRGATLSERWEAAIEWLDESGLISVLILVAIILAAAWLFWTCLTPVYAQPREPGPEPSSIAGLAVALIPIAIAVVLMAFATRGQPVPADDEAFGDATGFGETER